MTRAQYKKYTKPKFDGKDRSALRKILPKRVPVEGGKERTQVLGAETGRKVSEV